MLSLGWGLIWTIINLIVLYLLLKKFLIGPLLGIMEKRKTLIAQQLENARTTEGKANELKGQYEMAISGAKSESAQIIEEAKADARTLTERTVREANEQQQESWKVPERRQNRKRKMPWQAQNPRLQVLLWKQLRRCLQAEAKREAECSTIHF